MNEKKNFRDEDERRKTNRQISVTLETGMRLKLGTSYKNEAPRREDERTGENAGRGDEETKEENEGEEEKGEEKERGGGIKSGE